jgi:hypothetical protein
MKQTLFVVSHMFGGSEQLSKTLNEHPSIQVWSSGIIYDSMDKIILLNRADHKDRTTRAIYGDQIFYNHAFYCKAAYGACKFIYIIDSPKIPLNLMLSDRYYPSVDSADSYYRFRLRRIYEMAKNTPGAVVLTRDMLLAGKGLDLIEEYLDLNSPLPRLSFKENKVEEKLVPSELASSENAFERYLYRLKSLPLRIPTSQA